MVLKLKEQVIRGHHPTAEKMASHPIVVTTDIEGIGKSPMGENMDEYPGLGLQPAADTFQQVRPVAHVLKHFRNKAVKDLSLFKAIPVQFFGGFESAIHTLRYKTPGSDFYKIFEIKGWQYFPETGFR